MLLRAEVRVDGQADRPREGQRDDKRGVGDISLTMR